MTKRIVITSISALFYMVCLFPQNREIKGFTLDRNGIPVAYVYIQINNSYTLSDTLGFYKLDVHSDSSRFVLNASRIGYIPIKDSVVYIQEEHSPKYVIYLTEDSRMLDEVTIYAQNITRVNNKTVYRINKNDYIRNSYSKPIYNQ